MTKNKEPGQSRNPPEAPTDPVFSNFAEFYPYYLEQHRNRTCRRLHVTGTLVVIVTLLWVLLGANWWGLVWLPIQGYGFAWVGHAFFEHNRPATFRYPLYSLMGDFAMFRDVLRGRIDW